MPRAAKQKGLPQNKIRLSENDACPCFGSPFLYASQYSNVMPNVGNRVPLSRLIRFIT